MPEYKLIVHERCTHTVYIVADNEDDAYRLLNESNREDWETDVAVWDVEIEQTDQNDEEG